MSTRELVIEHVTQRMTEVFLTGSLIDAQNMNVFVSALEEMTDDEYADFAADGEAVRLSDGI